MPLLHSLKHRLTSHSYFFVAAFGRLFLLESSMSVKEKLIACAIAALFLLCIVAVYGYLVVSGKAAIDPFLGVLTTLVTVVVGLVTGLAGHAAAVGAADPAQPSVPQASTPAGLPASPTAPTAGAAAAGTALAPPAALQ
jgi:hypothetical protein